MGLQRGAGFVSVLDPSWDWDVDDESGLRFYDRKTGRYLCDFTLVEADRDAAVAELARAVAERNAATAERNAAMAERNAVAAERDVAQERIRQLEAELGRRQPPGTPHQ